MRANGHAPLSLSANGRNTTPPRGLSGRSHGLSGSNGMAGLAQVNGYHGTNGGLDGGAKGLTMSGPKARLYSHGYPVQAELRHQAERNGYTNNGHSNGYAGYSGHGGYSGYG